MARHIGTEGKVYRAIITRRKYVQNPDYRVVYDSRGSHAEGGDRYTYSETDTETTIYGVYDTPGPAKAHITKAERKDYLGNPHPSFVGATLQVGEVHWEDVPNE